MQFLSRINRSDKSYALHGKAVRSSGNSAGNLHGRTVTHRVQLTNHCKLSVAYTWPHTQKRHYSQNINDGKSLEIAAGTHYFEEKGFSEADIARIKKTADGVTFRVIPLPEEAHEDLKATEKFVNTFFKKVIQSHPDSCALGGEKVLLFNPAKPQSGKPDSSFLMAFDGEQDPHFHGGPRHLDMWSSKPWTVIVGGSDAKVLGDDEIHFTKIQFPAGHVSLSFKKGMLHGFSGEGIGAISTHWTDAEELVVARSEAGASSDTSDSNLMGTLTKFVDKEKIRIISGQSIPWHAISTLQASSKPEDL